MWVLASQLFSLWLSPPIGEIGKEIDTYIIKQLSAESSVQPRQLALSLILCSKKNGDLEQLLDLTKGKGSLFVILLHCLENSVKCVFPVDAEAEAQKRYRTADVSRRREAEASMVFLCLMLPPQRPPPAPGWRHSLPTPGPLVTSWLSSPFSSQVSIRRVRKGKPQPQHK